MKTKVPEYIIREAARFRFYGNSFRETAELLDEHFNYKLSPSTVHSWESRHYKELWQDEIKKMEAHMEKLQEQRRQEFTNEWHEWQNKVKQIAYSNFAIAAKQTLMIQDALKVITTNHDAVESISKSAEIGLDKFSNQTQALQKTATALMKEYFQLDEIIEELNRRKGDRDDNN